MTADLYDFNSTFFLSLATMVFGFCAGALGYALKSKCSSVKLCGCIEIIRDVELEADIEENMMHHNEPITNNPSEPNVSAPRRESHRRSQLANQLVDFTTSMTESKREDI